MSKSTWIYLRLHETEAEDTAAELAQREATLRAYAAERGMKVVGTSNDVASANDQERPGFRQMMDAAERKEFDALLVDDAARLTRDVKVLMEIGNTLASYGVDILTPQNEKS